MLITRTSYDIISNNLAKSQDALHFYSVSSSWQLTCLRTKLNCLSYFSIGKLVMVVSHVVLS